MRSWWCNTPNETARVQHPSNHPIPKNTNCLERLEMEIDEILGGWIDFNPFQQEQHSPLPVKDQRLRLLELLEILFTRISKSCNLLFLLQPFCKIQSFSFCDAFNSLMVLSFIGTTCNGGQQNRMALPTIGKRQQDKFRFQPA